MLINYFDKYYETLPLIVEKRDREFAEQFMSILSPAFMARESDEANFTKLLEKANPVNDYYV